MEYVKTFEGFMSMLITSHNTTRVNDPKSLVLFNEAKGPFSIGFIIHNEDSEDSCFVEPFLGDENIKKEVASVRFQEEWAKGVGVDSSHFNQLNINIGAKELISIATKAGFKKESGSSSLYTECKKDVKTPEEGLKELISFFKPLKGKINK